MVKRGFCKTSKSPVGSHSPRLCPCRTWHKASRRLWGLPFAVFYMLFFLLLAAWIAGSLRHGSDVFGVVPLFVAPSASL